jgi:hypothetical protein
MLFEVRNGWSNSRRLFHRAIPSHFRDPIGLAGRLVASGEDSRFAIYVAGLNLLATPIDWTLAARERRLYRSASPPRLPMVFICGPPRSGTTVVELAMARALPVAFFTNLTAVFPRAPITASSLLKAGPRNDVISLRSHYGRTAGFLAPNDGLHLWDRWFGPDRTSICHYLEESQAAEMVSFFGAFERWSERPLLAKNNSLNAHAALVADHLPTAKFICLQRDPVFLAQSLLIARRYIHGDDSTPYGLQDPEGVMTSDPVTDVCRQVRFYQDLAQRQLEALGPERFRIVSYDDFCRTPRSTVEMVAQEILHVPFDPSGVPTSLQPSRTQRLPDKVFRRLEREFEHESGT